ncbi:hypothetical protein A5905_06605 [Prescottella equi]|nr:hypothetical protein A5905_06605 [Prescottella equi]
MVSAISATVPPSSLARTAVISTRAVRVSPGQTCETIRPPNDRTLARPKRSVTARPVMPIVSMP